MSPMTGINNVTIENVTRLLNVSSPEAFFINVNNFVYGGWLYFIMLWALFFVLFITANKVRERYISNALYSLAVCTILSFLLRVVYVVEGGIRRGLLNDFQLWVFPILTVLFAVIIWSIQE